MKHRVLIIGSIAVVGIAALITATVPPIRQAVGDTTVGVISSLTPSPTESFPVVDSTQITPLQENVLSIAEAEYKKYPASYDENVLKYTQGAREAWCANFLSWVMQQAGHPYENPNSGSWRIPGVYTLQTYYQDQERYTSVNDAYVPQPGDVAFYIGKHTLGLFTTEHVALVVRVDGGMMTTLGGNELGKLRLTTQQIKKGEKSLVGFGKLYESDAERITETE